MSYRAWICETCGAKHPSLSHVWDCIGCGKECCESCFARYAHCKACAAGKSDEELRLEANENGFDFEPLEVGPVGSPRDAKEQP